MEEESLNPKPVQFLHGHIKKLLQSGDGINGENGFDLEFTYIERKTERDFYPGDYASALQPYNNYAKNRYANVLPLEMNRVILSSDGTEGSDYINASYINGLIPGSERAYICTQGPIENSTVDDFWRMVWEQGTNVIAMLTLEVENSKIRCSRYWPEEFQAAIYGRIRVTLVRVHAIRDVVIRTLLVENMRGASRTVTQFQYIAWPDHGLPVTASFLAFIRMVDEQKKTGPLVVHCWAGIGRSGTFCTIHSTIVKFWYDKVTKPGVIPSFDILDTVIYMRQQRPGMVQTRDQYKFCYLAVDEDTSRVVEELLLQQGVRGNKL